MDNIIKSDSGFENEDLVPEQTDKIVSKREMLVNEKMKQIMSGSLSLNNGNKDKRESAGTSENSDKPPQNAKSRKLTGRRALILALIIVGIMIVTVLTVFLIIVFGIDPDGHIEPGDNVLPSKKEYEMAYQKMVKTNRPLPLINVGPSGKEPVSSGEPSLEAEGATDGEREATPFQGSMADPASTANQAPTKTIPVNVPAKSPEGPKQTAKTTSSEPPKDKVPSSSGTEPPNRSAQKEAPASAHKPAQTHTKERKVTVTTETTRVVTPGDKKAGEQTAPRNPPPEPPIAPSRAKQPDAGKTGEAQPSTSGTAKAKTNAGTAQGQTSSKLYVPTADDIRNAVLRPAGQTGPRAAPAAAQTPPKVTTPAGSPPVGKPAVNAQAPRHNSANNGVENAFVDKNGKPLVRKHPYNATPNDPKFELNVKEIFNPTNSNADADKRPMFQIKHRDIYDLHRDRFLFQKTYGDNFKPNKPLEFGRTEIDVSTTARNVQMRRLNKNARMYTSDNRMNQIKKITHQKRLTLVEDTEDLEYLTVLEEKMGRLKLVTVVATHNPHRGVDRGDRERRYVQFKFALNGFGSTENVYVTEDVLNTLHTIITSRYK